jgi:hypothetical protein
LAILRIDHAEHGLGLRKIEPAGDKRPQRELARLRQARTLIAHVS